MMVQSKMTISRKDRSGVIPYTIDNKGKLHFLLGIDRKTGDLTDFGGGVKANEDFFSAGAREFSEETCEIFDPLTEQDLRNAVPIYNNYGNSVIFLVKINRDWLQTAQQTFAAAQAQRITEAKYTELSGLFWVHQDEFKSIAFNKDDTRMWVRLQNIFRFNAKWKMLYITLVLHVIMKELQSINHHHHAEY